MLKIWGRNTSSNVQKVLWALGELQLPFGRFLYGEQVCCTQAVRSFSAATKLDSGFPDR